MKLFRFCRWSLAALPVFLVFISCDKLLPTSGNGELVPVKIRSVSVKGYGEASATRSAGDESRIVGQPIVQDLGDGMLAEISVEEDVSALRDDQRLDDDAKFRIVALKENTSEIYSWADYTATTSGDFSKVAGNLHVVSGVKYDFVCFSYNDPSTATYWPNPLNESDALGVLTVDNTRDFLYKKLTAQKLDATNNTLSFTLEQQLTKVTLILDAESRTITNVANTIKILSVSTPTTFNLAATTNALSGTAASDVSFTSWGSANTIRQDLLRLLPKSDASTLNLPEEAITVGDTWKSEAKTISLPALAVGSSYTIRLTLVKLPKFAGSNIYWDSSKSQLTFDEHGTTTHQYYQGVYFKWGSLIGIAAGMNNEAYTPGSTVLYKPTNTSATPGTARTWTIAYDTDNAWSGRGWENIPSYDDRFITTPVDEDAKTLLDANYAKFTEYKGDICNYINPAYYMPTMNELDSLRSYYKRYTAGDITVSKAEGTYEVTTQYVTFAGIVFPASGLRYYNSGDLKGVGQSGYYWSGSATSDTMKPTTYEFAFNSSGVSGGVGYRSIGMPVRCVKIE